MHHITVGLGVMGFVVLLFLFAFRRRDKPVPVKVKELGEFTRGQVAQHNSREDLWLILKLDGELKVFDVTSYVDEHPGGDNILSNAGGDSTDLFTGPQHPPRVYDLIDEFCIGYVVEDS
jgi:cytochrome b involved in lipid metabolism